MNKEMEDEYWRLKTEKVVDVLRAVEEKHERDEERQERRRLEEALIKKNASYVWPIAPSFTDPEPEVSDLYRFSAGIGVAGVALACKMLKNVKKTKKVKK